MHIALNGSQQIAATLAYRTDALRLDMGLQNLHRALHRAGRLNHLRQEHLTLAKQTTHNGHTLHQRALDNRSRRGVRLQRLLQVGSQILIIAVLQRRRKTLLKRYFVTVNNRHNLLNIGTILLGHSNKVLGSTLLAAQYNVLQHLQQRRGNIAIHNLCRGVHDSHIQTRANSVVEEHSVHSLTQIVISA